MKQEIIIKSHGKTEEDRTAQDGPKHTGTDLLMTVVKRCLMMVSDVSRIGIGGE